MANRLSTEKQKLAIRLLCEGHSIRGTSRILGSHKNTIGNLILAFGQAAQNFLDEKLRSLNLRHVEVDEMWSFVGKKQARLTIEEKATSGTTGDIYLWTALDQDTKLIASYAVGKRSADMARRLMVDLASRIDFPNPHASDDHHYETRSLRPVVQISTDGFSAYREAIDLAFGPYAAHGVLIKEYRNATMQYTPSEMVGADRRVIRGGINQWSICTSHIERHNLTVRDLL